MQDPVPLLNGGESHEGWTMVKGIYPWGDDPKEIDEYAWYDDNSDKAKRIEKHPKIY